MSNHTLEDQLIEFGCTRKEAKIYLDVYLNGSTSVQQIAKRMNVNRVTVHSAVEQLIEKELLSESREGKRRSILAEPPDQLLQILNQKERQLKKLRETTEKTVSLLNALPREDYSDPNIRIYKGMSGLKRMLEETLEAKNKLRVFVDIEQFIKLLPADELLDLYRRRAAKNIQTKFIWPRGSFSKKIMSEQKRLKIELKTIEKPRDWKVAFYSWNDKVGIESLVEGQVQCTIIKNKEIAWFYQHLIFDSLWELLD